MLNNFKAFLFFLLWALVALTSHYFISNKHFNNCNLTVTVFEAGSTYSPFLISDAKNKLIFKVPQGFTITKNNIKVSSIDSIPNLKDRISNYLLNDYSKELHITGNYSQQEATTYSIKNIGLQRAEFVKKEFINNGFDPLKIKIFGKVLNFEFNKEATYTNGIELNFKNVNQHILDSLESNIKNKTLYLEFKNDSLMPTKILTDYTLLLKQFLQKNTDKKVVITGHTDNLGYYENNLIIGLNRAKNLQEYFSGNGINFNKIETFSKGESEPIAEKITEAGRAKNRRIEIKIN